jgi:hypothetical protein
MLFKTSSATPMLPGSFRPFACLDCWHSLSRTVTSEIAERARNPIKVAALRLSSKQPWNKSLDPPLDWIDAEHHSISKGHTLKQKGEDLAFRLGVECGKGLRTSLSAFPKEGIGWLVSHDIIPKANRSWKAPLDRLRVSKLTWHDCGAAGAQSAIGWRTPKSLVGKLAD